MIDETLTFLRDHLNDHLLSLIASEDPQDVIVFGDPTRHDMFDLPKDAVTLVLLNVEEDRSVRRDNPFTKTLLDGTVVKVQPDISLNLYLLFASCFKQYDQSWRYLSWILQYFQKNPVLAPDGNPQMNPALNPLTMELVSLPFSEQNEIWSALRIPQKPSLIYRAKMVTFSDDEARAAAAIGQINLDVSL